MQDYRKLAVWQLLHQLVLDVYQASAGFPPDELYGLTSQIKRTAASVPTNIRKVVGAKRPASFAGFCTLQWDRPVSWSIFCLWHVISTFLDKQCTNSFTRRC